MVLNKKAKNGNQLTALVEFAKYMCRTQAFYKLYWQLGLPVGSRMDLYDKSGKYGAVEYIHKQFRHGYFVGIVSPPLNYVYF